jgi:oligoendopeptidase F
MIGFPAMNQPDNLARGPAAVSASECPAWDLSEEYPSFDHPSFLADLEAVDALLSELEGLSPEAEKALARAEGLDPAADADLLESALRFLERRTRLETLFDNLRTYANCRASLDGQDAKAKEFRGIFSTLGARIDKAESAFALLLARASDAFAEALLASPRASGDAFAIRQARKFRDRLLELHEERVVSSLYPDGFEAWSRLYDAIAGTARARYVGPDPAGAPGAAQAAARVERDMGLSEVASLLRAPDRSVREAAFRAQTAAFETHAESLAAILNALAGHRLAEYGLRSRKAPMRFLDAALAMNHMEEATLEAMMSVVDASRDLGRKALRLQARLLGVEKPACYDLLAPLPARGAAGARTYTFSEGFDLVRAAYASVEPAMGDFVDGMLASGRIEARVLAAKRPGAYCTGFPKSGKANVFLTYRGNLADVSTLAHELGHAYHESLVASLSLMESRYPMNLAETASTFAETALGDYLDSGAAGGADGANAAASNLLEVAWSDAQDASTFLLNIPARFAFEKAFYEARGEKPLGPDALSDLMGRTWETYYGDSLSELDPGFWRSKLHFYKSAVSFYNFPYTFGYLFSLGVYARRAELGRDFHQAYCALLRDTGRMETEELAMKHLGVDLRKPDFWEASIGIVRKKVERFERMVEEIR